MSQSNSEQQPNSTTSSAPLSSGNQTLLVNVAGFNRRVAAVIIDFFVLCPVLACLGWLAFRVTGLSISLGRSLWIESVIELFIGGGSLVYSLIAMGLIIFFLYGFLFINLSGSTPGLRFLRLRIINPYGGNPEGWRLVVRFFGSLLSLLLLGLGFVWVAFDREKRGLHDWLAGTYVIYSDAPAIAKESPL